jgi:integrase
VPIEVAAGEYVEAFAKLKGRATLAAAVDFYVRRHAVAIEPKRVVDVITECLASKRQDKLSERYLKQLEYDLKRFALRFQNHIGAVAGPDIDAWLRELEVSGRTRNNIRMSVQTLMSFAKAKRYLPKDHDEMESVPLAKELEGEIEIFTPGEMAELMAAASDATVPFFALGAFAGVRHAEIKRLDWRDIQMDHDLIEIRAGKAKTASRRVIPILPNLKAWLKDHRKTSGPVCSYANMGDEILDAVRRVNTARRAAWAKAHRVGKQSLLEAEEKAREWMAEAREEAGPYEALVPPGAETAAVEGWEPLAWKHNGLRHSFISYRVAEVQNVAQVALEAGNSPQIIFKNYRELVRPAAAKEWFSISPKG